MTKKVKLGDIALAEFEGVMLREHGDLMNKNPKIAAEVIRNVYEENKQFAVARAISMATSGINEQISMQSARDVTGVILGAYDRANTNMPLNCVVQMPNGKNVVVSSWDHTSKDLLGGAIELKYPAKGNYRIVWSESKGGYKSWNLLGIGKQQVLDPNKEDLLGLVQKMGIMALPDVVNVPLPPKENAGVVFSATINQIFPINVEKKSEDKFPVWMETTVSAARGKDSKVPRTFVPCFKIRTATVDRVNAWITVAPRKEALGLYDITDLDLLCQMALKRSDKPDVQAAYLSSILEGTNIIVVANLWSKNEGSNESVDYSISCGSTAILEIGTDYGLEEEIREEIPETPEKIEDQPAPQQIVETPVEPEEPVEVEATPAPAKKPTRSRRKKEAPAAEEQVPEPAAPVPSVPVPEEPPTDKPTETQNVLNKEDMARIDAEILAKLKFIGGMMGYSTIGEIPIAIFETSRGFKAYSPKMVETIWSKHQATKTEQAPT